jgi:hypothetical protein
VPETTGTKQQEQANASTMCPDDMKIELEYCEFDEVKAALHANGNAKDRMGNAMAVCGQYDQTTISFCLRFLYPLAEKELTAAYAKAKPSPSVAALENWKRGVESKCTPDYPPEKGGSGYSSRISFCEIKAYAEKIDQLSQISGSGTN